LPSVETSRPGSAIRAISGATSDGRPFPRHQPLARDHRIGRAADHLDHLGR
jgi:hypothetical protein